MKRKNSKNRNRKKKMVPKKIVRSTHVGEYDSHFDGKNSRSRLSTMMTKRSAHMPTLIAIDAQNSTQTFRRSLRDQKSCGTSTLPRSITYQSSDPGAVGRALKNCWIS